LFFKLRLGGQGSLPPSGNANDCSAKNGRESLTQCNERGSRGHSQEEGEGNGDDGELHLEWWMVGWWEWLDKVVNACRSVVVSVVLYTHAEVVE
jgi:hypothetical protein